ncbi:hypothetical protein Q5Y75_05795 [Ruegeria sp. 2205SS24-7]|uniref:hypothetical protein n=1 Tax=Ruegeria discodermiae TaxID=3064389 RepID=UPI002740A1A5|nr:hypothetical protein [Ruegeria sp. 2205SS24-7]MDP5216724.1 hypothetical protein [Ruegeria sp. 2205SS24-7]
MIYWNLFGVAIGGACIGLSTMSVIVGAGSALISLMAALLGLMSCTLNSVSILALLEWHKARGDA